MLRSVKLDRLPDGVQFPAELSDRIDYDADARTLRFDGFMSKCDFDKLVRLSNDASYQRAIERLFQICTFSGDCPSKRMASPTVLAAATALTVAVGVTSLLLLLF